MVQPLTSQTVTLAAVNAELARRSLPEFIRQAWPLVEPGVDLSWNWHLDELCEALEAVTRGELKRVIINIPPGSSKSLTISVFWPAWEWASDATLRYLTASYSDANTIRDNRRLRSIVTSDWYQRSFGLVLAADQTAKTRFDTAEKGWRIATSVGGAGTGEHPNRIIIDDPTKAAEARSSVSLDACAQWFDRTISTRVALDPAIIVVMQRLHQDDLAGHLLAKGGWEHICLPMRFDPERRDPRDHRTMAGELLWPELWPEAKVRQEEIDLGAYGAAGQLQQRPAPEGGGLFKREWFPVVDEAPAEGRECRGWDTAATPGGGDWTVGVKLLEATDGFYYVKHAARDQLGPGGVDALILSTAQVDGKAVWVREEQEGGSAGKAVIQSRAKSLVGYNYAGVSITGDKVTRANPLRAQCEAGNVRLVRGEWNEAYLDVMTSFPVGRHDDDTDATSCAFNALVSEKVRPRWGLLT